MDQIRVAKFETMAEIYHERDCVGAAQNCNILRRTHRRHPRGYEDYREIPWVFFERLGSETWLSGC